MRISRLKNKSDYSEKILKSLLTFVDIYSIMKAQRKENKMFRLDLMIQRKVYKQDFAEDIQTAKALRNNYIKDGYVVAMYNDSIKNNKGNSVLLSVAGEYQRSY